MKRITITCLIILLDFLIDKTLCCPVECSCADTSVDCSARSLSEIPSQIPTSTTSLILSNNQISSIKSDAFTRLENLQTIDLTNNLLERVDGVFEGLTSLTTILLSVNRIDFISSAFANLTNLVTLNLDFNPFLHCTCDLKTDIRALDPKNFEAAQCMDSNQDQKLMRLLIFGEPPFDKCDPTTTPQPTTTTTPQSSSEATTLSATSETTSINSGTEAPDPCASSPCENSGTCKSIDSAYACSCLSKWTGSRCESALVAEGGGKLSTIAIVSIVLSGVVVMCIITVIVVKRMSQE